MINRVNERALRVILGDDLSDFESLLQNNKDLCSNHKNSQSLMIEMFKIKNELAPPIMDSCLRGEMNLITSAIFKNFWQKEKELCIMVLRHLNIGLHNYGLFLQKTSRKLNHTKHLRGK